ncbi:DUF1998 domain-containing protein [Paraliomyxa miuraensis]|uniref:DUF1998 domain-containing protein n=1 Tax=Paraliomyxa miuraensis TaxID=376150 RepID=UPI002255807A|nr:DUF1998 domain-containing protein [Paraliomyxa miuraensis]MCX4239768.1 DUF1998 domain-containing protein [Paraliomyxa miuraensis]
MSPTPKSSVGQIRQSQIVTTFGPGALVDLPDHSVIVGGLDHWAGEMRPIREDRLTTKIAEVLGVSEVTLRAPPVDSDSPHAATSGITTFTFPAWFLAQYQDELPDGGRTRPLVHWNALEKRRFLGPDRKRHAVVPVRFVRACPNGHIDDIDWIGFAHRDYHTACRGQLWLDEHGTTGDLAELQVRCEACKATRPLSALKGAEGHALGSCNGKRPWLGRSAREDCVGGKDDRPHHARLLTRSASNAYFSQTLSVISLPEPDERLRNAVDLVWEDFLQYCEDLGDVERERRKQKVAQALVGLSDDLVWQELQRRRGVETTQTRGIKQAELETLLSDELGRDDPSESFYATVRSLDGLPEVLVPIVERIVLVHRLREVTAQIGFTRFEAAMTDADGELDLDVRRAALSLDCPWVPATEQRGEGVFVAIRPEAIRQWLRRRAVIAHGRRLEEGFSAWKQAHGRDRARFPGLPYVMLHSLAHLLITAVALECGYSASSIRERVYATGSGCGILLYTATPGAEGTLGGLVEVGRRIERHLLTALDMGRLCSNDPVCAGHEPNATFEQRFLHGAACHGCLLIAETSCEQRNELLDRALVIPTVSVPDAAFFAGISISAADVSELPAAPDAPVDPRLSAPIPTELDLEDFDEPWQPFVARLAAHDELRLEAGGEVADDRGRVIGRTVIRIQAGSKLVHVLDAHDPESEAVAALLHARGARAILLTPDADPSPALLE